MRIIFKAQSVKKLADNYSKARFIVGDTVNRGLRKLYRILEPILKAETPVRTGRLRTSTRGQILYSGRDQVLSVRQGAKTSEGAFYGRFVREGTRQHEIKPRRPGGVLAFHVGGEMVFARRVLHPGTSPNPYHIRTMGKARPQIEAIATEIASDIVAITHRRGAQ